jgi:hypothetical protein
MPFSILEPGKLFDKHWWRLGKKNIPEFPEDIWGGFQIADDGLIQQDSPCKLHDANKQSIGVAFSCRVRGYGSTILIAQMILAKKSEPTLRDETIETIL